MDKIKPEELRLGNWVKWPEEKEPNEVQWEHGHWLGVFEKNYGYPEPIPLSPDWLERFGFKINNERDPESCSFDYMHIGLFYIGEFNRSGWLLNAYDSMPPMQYIHQLQNLYFALTGNELSLGPNQ